MSIKDSEILFITTSLFTKWQGYSDALIEHFFPGSMRKHVSGKGGLFLNKWYEWTDVAIQTEGVKYVVHIDEDCFLLGRRPLKEVIEWMDCSTYDLMGVSDGYTNCRRKNPIALNAFLMVVRRDTLVRFKGYERLEKPTKTIESNFHYPHPICGVKADPNKIEPYYPFFWTLLNQGHRFYYLWPGFDHNIRGATIPAFDQYSEAIALHMWWLRRWDDWDFTPWGVSNPRRYEMCEENIIKPLLYG